MTPFLKQDYFYLLLFGVLVLNDMHINFKKILQIIMTMIMKTIWEIFIALYISSDSIQFFRIRIISILLHISGSGLR